MVLGKPACWPLIVGPWRVPVHIVAARLGHADPAITLRVYAHVIRSAEAVADISADAVNAAC
jgi:integrase